MIIFTSICLKFYTGYLEALLNKIQVDIEVDYSLENLTKGRFKTIPFIRVVLNGKVIILIC